MGDNRPVADEIAAAAFADLTPALLYEVLALRVAVFVVEQRCAFQELDGRDTEPTARHWWLRRDGGPLAAVLRVLAEPDGTTRIGRVVSSPAARGRGAAGALMGAALDGLDGPVVLGAQADRRGFYERFGFAVCGPAYDEDGIRHVPMRRG